MMISETSRHLQDKRNIIDVSIIKKFLEILSVSLIIFTITFFACFGCFLVLNDSTNMAAEKVTLSSEGQHTQTYQDSMGDYQLARRDLGADGTSSVWYRHLEREDRSLMYNKFGNIDSKYKYFH